MFLLDNNLELGDLGQMGSFLKLKHIIEGKENFLLIAHEQPDGDCLGGMLAMNEALLSLGKKVRMVCRSPIPAVFSFLEGTNDIHNDFLLGNFDAIILIDNGDLKRTGFGERLLESSLPLLNIDHHPKNDLWKKVRINYVDETVSSTCELIYQLISGLGVVLTPKIATFLLTGIFTDTGGFRHTNTSKETLDIVSILLRRGAKLKLISENIINSRTLSTLKLWGIALRRLKVSNTFSLIYSVILHNDIIKVGATDDEVAGLINLISTSPESKVALLLYETADGKIKGSLRTESPDINLTVLAKRLGGGGHKKASGFALSGHIEEIATGWRVL